MKRLTIEDEALVWSCGWHTSTDGSVLLGGVEWHMFALFFSVWNGIFGRHLGVGGVFGEAWVWGLCFLSVREGGWLGSVKMKAKLYL